jgi:hypothetical protein
MNSVWNTGSLVNGTDFTQSISMDSANSPDNTTISWDWPDTPATWNVYSMPGVFYGTYDGFAAPANTVTPMQVDDINTLTLNHNITLSGQTDQYDVIYDLYLTSTPGGSHSDAQFEIEVVAHTPSYMRDWIETLPQKTFTDADGLQWTIAQSGSTSTSDNPPIILFVPSDYRDLTNASIDFKALLDAAQAEGLITGNEYFNGLGLGVEPRLGSGSLDINSLSVDYDGDTYSGTQVASPAPATISLPDQVHTYEHMWS